MPNGSLTPASVDAAAVKARDLLGELLVGDRRRILALYRASRGRLEDAVEYLFRHFIPGENWDWAGIRAAGLWPRLQQQVTNLVDEMQGALGGLAAAEGEAVWAGAAQAAGRVWGVEPTITALGLYPQALTTEWAGATVFDRFLNVTEALGEKLLQQTRTSMLAGETFEEWTSRVRDAFGDTGGLYRPKASAYGSVNVWEAEARRLWNEMNTQTAEALGADQMWWTHSLFMPDVQTTPLCASRHGRLRSELPEDANIPAHHGCLCEWVTVDPAADPRELRAVRQEARERADDWAFEHFEDATEEGAWDRAWRRHAREAWDPQEHPRDPESGRFAGVGLVAGHPMAALRNAEALVRQHAARLFGKAPRGLWLVGSRAGGRDDPGADVDLLADLPDDAAARDILQALLPPGVHLLTGTPKPGRPAILIARTLEGWRARAEAMPGGFDHGARRRWAEAADPEFERKHPRQPSGSGRGGEFAPAGSGVDTAPAFRGWFADSKVVDSRGNPQVVFHGSNVAGISEFKSSYGAVTGWFSEDRGLADQYASAKTSALGGKKTTYPVFLSIQKPLVIKGDMNEKVTYSDFRRDTGLKFTVGKYGDEVVDGVEQKYSRYQIITSHEFVNAARGAGFDGILAQEGGKKTWGAFDAGQIKIVKRRNVQTEVWQEELLEVTDPEFERKHPRDERGRFTFAGGGAAGWGGPGGLPATELGAKLVAVNDEWQQALVSKREEWRRGDGAGYGADWDRLEAQRRATTDKAERARIEDKQMQVSERRGLAWQQYEAAHREEWESGIVEKYTQIRVESEGVHGLPMTARPDYWYGDRLEKARGMARASVTLAALPDGLRAALADRGWKVSFRGEEETFTVGERRFTKGGHADYVNKEIALWDTSGALVAHEAGHAALSELAGRELDADVRHMDYDPASERYGLPRRFEDPVKQAGVERAMLAVNRLASARRDFEIATVKEGAISEYARAYLDEDKAGRGFRDAWEMRLPYEGQKDYFPPRATVSRAANENFAETFSAWMGAPDKKAWLAEHAKTYPGQAKAFKVLVAELDKRGPKRFTGPVERT